MSTPFHRAAVHLRNAASVVVCGHVRPDGDAVGAVLGITLALREAGIPAVPTLADDREPPSTYSFLPGFGLYAAARDLEVPAVFVSVDSPNAERLGIARDLALAAETLVVIDHHPDNTGFGAVNIVDSAASASAQLVWHLLEPLEVAPNPEIAQCCYVGLVTDTGRFQYDNTTPQTLRDAAAMLEAGVDPAEVSRLVYQERSSASLALEARLLSRLALENDGRVAWAWLDDADFIATGARPEEAEHLPDAIRVIAGIEVAVLLRSIGGEVRGNLRSKTGYDVGAVARHYGGGGHRAASGFTFVGSIDDLVPDLMSRLPGGALA